MGSYGAMEFLLAIMVILSLSIFHATAQFNLPQFLGLDPCAKVECGLGKCVNSSAALLGFDCVCDHGWTKIQFGPLSSPCINPDCLSSFQCGNGAPPSLPCGDGNWVVNGTNPYCQCNDGSDNMFNATALPCLPECYFETDCEGKEVQLGNPLSPENGEGNEQNPNSPSPNPPGNGSNNMPKFSWSNGALTTLLLITIFLLF